MKLELKHLSCYPMCEDSGLLIQTKLRKATKSGKPLGYYTGRLIGVSARGSGVEIVFDKDDFAEDFDLKDVKLILRPMSDITKPIEGKDTTYMCELWEMKTQSINGVFEGYNIENDTAQMVFGTWQHPNSQIEHKHYFEIDLDAEDITFAMVTETIENGKIIDESFGLLGNEFKMYQYLYEHHFDVFGLIEKGLAIDINTLKP